jgi:hypothetical protein
VSSETYLPDFVSCRYLRRSRSKSSGEIRRHHTYPWTPGLISKTWATHRRLIIAVRPSCWVTFRLSLGFQACLTLGVQSNTVLSTRTGHALVQGGQA